MKVLRLSFCVLVGLFVASCSADNLTKIEDDRIGKELNINFAKLVTGPFEKIFGLIESKIDLNKTIAKITFNSYLNFLKVFRKSYNNSEIKRRFEIFKNRIPSIIKSKIDFLEGKSSFSLGVNQFLDWDRDELEAGRSRVIQNQQFDDTEDYSLGFWGNSEPKIADGKDYRVTNCISRPRNQGDCGSCYSFAIMSVIETMTCMSRTLNPNGNSPIQLSTQELVDCFGGEEQGCNGAHPNKAIQYFNNRRNAVKDSCYRYTAERGRCRRQDVERRYDCLIQIEEPGKKISTTRLKGRKSIAAYVEKKGPVIGEVETNDDWKFYKTGILVENKGSKKGERHAVVIIGFGSDNGVDYWLFKNSWGRFWGEGGYGRVKRNKNSFDIENYAHTVEQN